MFVFVTIYHPSFMIILKKNLQTIAFYPVFRFLIGHCRNRTWILFTTSRSDLTGECLHRGRPRLSSLCNNKGWRGGCCYKGGSIGKQDEAVSGSIVKPFDELYEECFSGYHWRWRYVKRDAKQTFIYSSCRSLEKCKLTLLWIQSSPDLEMDLCRLKNYPT